MLQEVEEVVSEEEVDLEVDVVEDLIIILMVDFKEKNKNFHEKKNWKYNEKKNENEKNLRNQNNFYFLFFVSFDQSISF